MAWRGFSPRFAEALALASDHALVHASLHAQAKESPTSAVQSLRDCDLVSMEVSTLASQGLLSACKTYQDTAKGLLDALERDVYNAAESCWRLQDRPLELSHRRVLRSKTVIVQEAVFLPDVEQQALVGALDQWRSALQGAAASAALQVRVAEQQLLLAVGRSLHQEGGMPAEQLLSLLDQLLTAYDSVLGLKLRDLRSTLTLLSQLAAQVAAAWRRQAGSSDVANNLLAAHAAAPKEVITALTEALLAPGAAAAAATEAAGGGEVPADLAASLEALQQRQQELEDELSTATDVLRYWGRRSEKAAAGAEGAGREGDVPPMLAEAQQLLWAASQAHEEEQGPADISIRRLVCQRYKPSDVTQLQQHADQYGDGERLPAQQTLVYEQEFVVLRGGAQTRASQFLQGAPVGRAAEQLHQLQYLLLQAQLPPETETAWQQLLVRVAEALLDGSTPPAAVPLLASWLQEALQRVGGPNISEQDKARLVPMICRCLKPGARIPLRHREAAGLLRSLATPDALLEQGHLLQFYFSLKAVVDACSAAGVPSDAAAFLLAAFDATRFAVLVCEKATEVARVEEGGSAGSGSASQTHVSMQQLLELVHASLAQPGAEATGLALLEGLLTLQPASFLAAALQLALAGSTGQRSSTLDMLCRVPVELLPPAVLADALMQLTDALDGNLLVPPFLPYQLLGRLYSSAPVMHSMRLTVEQSSEAAAAAAAAEASAGRGGTQQLWTVCLPGRIGGSAEGGGTSGGAVGSDAAHAASGSGVRQEGAGGQGEPTSAGGATGSSSSSAGLVLLPLQPGPQPLAVLVQRLVGAVLSCLLRRTGTSLDAASLSEELLQLLELLLMPAAEQGAWMLDWLWTHLYQEALCAFLADATAALAPHAHGDVAGSGDAAPLLAAFQTYWASLPWKQATFHSASPAALATLRVHLVAANTDGAAAVLLRELDFAPVLAKAVSLGVPPPGIVDQVYSLDDEEAEEAATAAAAGTQDQYGRAAWATELGLLSLQAGVVLSAQAQPGWLQQLLHGVPAAQPQPSQQSATAGGEDVEDVHALMRSPLSAGLMPLAAAAGEHQPLLPHLLASADWGRLTASVRSEEAAADAAAPWLLLPLLLSPAAMDRDVGSRVVHAASLLGKAALVAASPQAAETATGAVVPLLLCTLCQGVRHDQTQQAAMAHPQQEAATAAAGSWAGGGEQQEQVIIPDDFPLELLEDTVEGQQLLLLKQQQGEQQAAAAAQAQAVQPAGTMAVAAEPYSGAHERQQQQEATAAEQQQQQALVEVRGCWSLSVDQHLHLLQQVLLPLASSQASLELSASWQAEQCPAELATAGQQDASLALHEWRPPQLADLVQAASAAAGLAPAAADSNSQSRAVAACIGSLLVPLAHQPVTILTTDPLPFRNSELPLDTQSALFVSVAPESASAEQSSGSAPAAVTAAAAASGSQDQQRRGLRKTLATLLPGAEARRRAQQARAFTGSLDAIFIQGQLRLAVQDACKQAGSSALAACTLRLLYACPALHACASTMQLAEPLLRSLAAPEQEGGPLFQGAAASALMEQEVMTSAASVAEQEVSLEAATEPMQSTAGGAAAGTATGSSIGAVAAAAAAVPPSIEGVQLAISAAQGLPQQTLVGLAHGAAQLHAPLTAALAVGRLKQEAAMLPKEEWQGLAASVLQVAVQADAEPAYPFDLVAVWMAALEWVADSRWRRLPSGPQTVALLEWLEALDLRVVSLHLAVPEDFTLDSPGGGSPGNLLSSATDRLKSMRQHIPGLKGGRPAATGTPASITGEPSVAGGPEPTFTVTTASSDAGHVAAGPTPGDGKQQLGQRLSQGFRSLLGKGQGEGRSKGGPPADAAAPPSGSGEPGVQGEKKGRLAGLRGKLAGKLGRPESPQQQQELPAPGPGAGLPGLPSGTALPKLSTVREESGTAAAGTMPAEDVSSHDAGSDAGHASASGSGGGAAVRQKITSGLQAMGRGLSRVRKLADRPVEADEVAEHDQDVAVRVGLAAFAVSAYVKSVLCPSLTPRAGDSAGPGTPTWRSLVEGSAAAGRGPAFHHHRQSSSLGSLRVDELYLRELDRVLEAQSELDNLATLATCPLLQHPSPAAAQFLQDAPQLLTSATSVQQFQQRLQQLLFASEAHLLAVM